MCCFLKNFSEGTTLDGMLNTWGWWQQGALPALRMTSEGMKLYYLSPVRAGAEEVGQPSWSYGHESTRLPGAALRQRWVGNPPLLSPSLLPLGPPLAEPRNHQGSPKGVVPSSQPLNHKRRQKEEAWIRGRGAVDSNQQREGARDCPKTYLSG